MNKKFGPEELGEIREDWKRNGDLGTEDRLERVAQLHACGPEDIARALDLEKKPEVQAKHIRRRADPEIRQAAVKGKFTKHADARLEQRDIRLTDEQMIRLEEGTKKA